MNDPRSKVNYYCFSTWSSDAGFSYDDRRKLPEAFPMIYYQALKGAKDTRAKNILSIAYLCELISSTDSSKKEKILQDYMRNSIQKQDSVNQTYVKRFINEIYVPIRQSTNQFYKDYNSNSGIHKNEIADAKIVVLYKNALIQAKKIFLPQVYQDYLNYYIYLYDRNK